jgi:dihydrofolate reductase
MDATADIDMKRKPGLISIIAALGKARAIGSGNELLWQIPDDMKRFKELTMGHPVIMGRKTWDSLPEKFRPLPGRTNIVVTRQASYDAPGAIVADSLQDALAAAASASGGEEIFIIGGAQLYAETLPVVNKLYLTLIEDEKEGDAYFPDYEQEFTKIVSDEAREWDGLNYHWLTLER